MKSTSGSRDLIIQLELGLELEVLAIGLSLTQTFVIQTDFYHELSNETQLVYAIESPCLLILNSLVLEATLLIYYSNIIGYRAMRK